MKIPAIRAKIGTWTYYISTLSFEQVSNNIEKIDDQLHSVELLRDLIQRSITKNYISIKDYIINQPEMFFNSLVLGVYNGMPKWIEVELDFNGEEFFDLGFLEFPSDQKIFPIDGQHRVEGIKNAFKNDPSLGGNKIGAIFVGHSIEPEGMKKSRRLFTTLNRYAKPVTLDDIIALDEDDSVAIVTRNLLENFNLFKGSRIKKYKSKAIGESDKESFTSIITLYQCNKELLKFYRTKRKAEDPNKERDSRSLDNYLKFRPHEDEIKLFEEFLINFWTSVSVKIDDVRTYLESENENPAQLFRNKRYGGSLLFRPVGLLPFIQAVIEIKKRTDEDFNKILENMNEVNYIISRVPWRNTLWNPIEKTMIMGTQVLVKLLFIYIYNKDILQPKEIQRLTEKYADKQNWDETPIANALNNIPCL